MDTVETINLLTPARLGARRRRARTRRWSAIVTLYTGIVSASVVVLRGAGSEDTSRLGARLVELDTQLAQTNAAIALLRQRSGALVASLKIERALNDRPDYSALLAAIGSLVGDRVVLQRVAIEPAGGEPDADVIVSLTGLAGEQQEVSRFVLALERTGLFARVELRSTNRHDLASIAAVRFEVRCVLDGGGR